MSDTITAKGSEAKFLPHPEGQYVAQCVDTIDLGEKVEDFPGKPKKLVHKCALVFRTGEMHPQTGEYIDIGREFTVSMGEKANLRKFLEQWRGKPYSAAQVEEGVPLHKLTGNWGLLTISHRMSEQGRTYANLTACVGVPKQMQGQLPSFDAYQRAEFWETRKKEYQDAARQFRADMGAPVDDEYPAALEDEVDDLPF